MKLKILTLILLCPVFLKAQKYDTISNHEEFYEHLFDNFQLNKLSTNLLLEQGHPFTRIDYYNGELSDSNYVDETELRKIYATLFTMQIKEKNQLKHYSEIEDLFAKGKGSNDTIYMAGFAFHYNRLIENAISSGEIILKNKKLVNNSNKIEDEFFVEKSMFAMGSLGRQELKQNQTFYLDNKSFFSDNEFKKKDLKVDFGDGNGFRDLKPGTYYSVNYQDQDSIKIIFSLEDKLQSHSKYYQISKSDAKRTIETGGDFTYPITADDKYSLSSNYASGTLTYDYGESSNEKLDKPILIVEGFDETDYVNPATLWIWERDKPKDYNSFLQKKLFEVPILLNRIESNGYDIVHLNFDKSTDYMQNSAYLVQKAIKELKAHSEREEDIVIIGLSSGGVIAKYALADWEKRFSEDHEVRLNVAFDAGFDGNNVPVGAQYMIAHLNDMRVSGVNLNFLFPTLLDMKKLIETPAARQMLSVHYRNDISLNQSFFNELNNLGNPKLCRNVSISNGDRIDDRPNLTPDQFIINKDRGVFEIVLPGLSEGFLLDIPTWGLFTRTLIQIKSLHNSNQSTNVYEGKYWNVNPFLFIYLVSGRDSYHSAKASYSTSAGGLFFSPDNVWTNFLRQVTFVPTASALDVMNHRNPQIYQNISSSTYNMCETPFDSWYTAPDNEAHVEWNDGNSEFLWNEIQSYNQPCQEKMCDDVYISGSSKVCGTQTYSIVNRPANSSISWTSSSNITITSGNGTNTITINKNGSGSGYVSARIVKSGCGTARIRKNVTIPSSSNSSISISGPTSGYENNLLNYTLSSISGGSSYSMTVRNYSGGCSSNCWTIYTNSSRRLEVVFTEPGTYQITGSAYNGCGTVSTYKYVTISSSGGGGGGECSASLQREGSNPSSGNMTYRVIEPIEPCDTYRTTASSNSIVSKDKYTSKSTYFSVIDARGFQVRQGELNKGSFALNMRKYPKGLYIVNVYWKGQLMTDRLIRE